MKELFLDMLKGLFLGICFVAIFFVIASVSRSAYSNTVHPHGESSLVTSNHQSVQTAPNAVFLCVPFGYASFMVRLNGDTFECASFFDDLLTNPVQSNRPHLVMNGSASLIIKGAHSHA